ncbi:MAG: hypothetical protein AAFX79_02685 [Planctomycetota bacterium]
MGPKLGVAACVALGCCGPAAAQDDPPADQAGDVQGETPGVQAQDAQGQVAESQVAESTEGDPPVQGPPPQLPPRFSFDLSQTGDFEAGGHIDGGGDVFVARIGQEVGLTWLPSLRTRARFTLGNELTFYDFDDAFVLDPIDGDPFDSFNEQSLGGSVFHVPNQTWTLVANGAVGFSREDDADYGDSFVWRVGGGALYRVLPNVSLGAGFLAQSRFDDEIRLLPIPLVDVEFQLAEDVRFVLNTVDGGRFLYEPSDAWTFSLIGNFADEQFRLDDEGFAPDGVFTEQRVNVFGEAEWKPLPGLSLRAGVGSVVYREYEIEDAEGVELNDATLDPAVYARFGLTYRF